MNHHFKMIHILYIIQKRINILKNQNLYLKKKICIYLTQWDIIYVDGSIKVNLKQKSQYWKQYQREIVNKVKFYGDFLNEIYIYYYLWQIGV